jgi:hypothetical protein
MGGGSAWIYPCYVYPPNRPSPPTLSFCLGNSHLPHLVASVIRLSML